MATYNVVSVLRTPQSSGVPTYTELGPLYASNIAVKDYKSLVPSEGSFIVPLRALDSDTKTALRDLAAQPLEVWVYRDGTRIFAGPVVGGSIKGDQVTLTCRGRLVYLSYMVVFADKSWIDTDLFTIGKTLVDDWQLWSYGHYGLLTDYIGTLGVTRSVSIPGSAEHPRVSDSLKVLSQGVFDIWADPDTDRLEFAASRGSDLSASVSIERGLTESAAGFALGPGLLASEAFVSGTSPTGVITTTKENAALRQSFGRSAISTSYDPVTDTNQLSDLADADLASVSRVYFTPGGDLFEVLEARYVDLEPGNTVEYSFDAGLGKFTANLRVQKRELSVTEDGAEKIRVEFE